MWMWWQLSTVAQCEMGQDLAFVEFVQFNIIRGSRRKLLGTMILNYPSVGGWNRLNPISPPDGSAALAVGLSNSV
jgi:hypothetical protein